jgi:hypothetical protein
MDPQTVASLATPFWIWPIPDAGDVEFVCDWPAQAIPESRIRIDGSVLRDAAARSIAVWPVEPT